MFITEPKREKKDDKITFVDDFKEGFKFLWNFKTLRNLFLLASLLNLFANAAFILILPYFKTMPFLGEERYGFFMAVIPMGMLIGSGFLSIINIKKNQKFKIYKFGALICLGTLPFVFIVENFYVMIPIAFISFLCNVVFNTIFNSAIMLVVPSDKRGKIGALMNTISGGLQPIGALVGGVLGEILPIRVAVLSLLGISFIFTIALVFVKGSKELMEYESSDGTVEELIEKTNSIVLES